MAIITGVWPPLERGELGSATDAEWRYRFGAAFDAVKRFLHRTSAKVEAIPEFGPHGYVRYWTVIEHAPDDLVGIDEDFGERRIVLDRERFVYAFDVLAFVAAIREALGLQRLADESPKDGLLLVGASGSKRVYVALPRNGAFGRSVRALALSSPLPCILLVPTTGCVDRETLTLAAAHRVEIRFLADVLHFDEHGLRNRHADQLQFGCGTESAAEFRFRLDGEVWDLAFEGESTKRRDTVGLRYIHRLLANPNSTIASIELAGDGQQNAVRSSQPVADGEMLRNIHTQLQELDIEIAEAERAKDQEEISRLNESRQELLDHLTPLLGKRGSAREFADAGKRASRSVGMAITRAVESIAKDLPNLARHLESAISTGAAVIYSPDSIPRWEL